jgi:hypothetical protein
LQSESNRSMKRTGGPEDRLFPRPLRTLLVLKVTGPVASGAVVLRGRDSLPHAEPTPEIGPYKNGLVVGSQYNGNRNHLLSRGEAPVPGGLSGPVLEARESNL